MTITYSEIELLKAKVDMLEQQVDFLLNGTKAELEDAEDDTPTRQTIEEWREYVLIWASGVKLDFYDFSEGEGQWHPDDGDAMYAYDDNIAYRVSP